jgi:hypothetical protein
MASDLPPTGHATSLAMAKVLVTYMDDPDAVRDAIRYHFDQPPDRRTIKLLRAEHLKPRPKAPAPLPRDAHRPWEEAAKAEETTKEFLFRLERERDYSVELARAQGALHSPLLTNQTLVDKALEREVDKARKAGGM